MCSCKKKSKADPPPLPEFAVTFQGSGGDLIEVGASQSMKAKTNNEIRVIRSGMVIMLPLEAVDLLIGIGAPLWKTA